MTYAEQVKLDIEPFWERREIDNTHVAFDSTDEQIEIHAEYRGSDTWSISVFHGAHKHENCVLHWDGEIDSMPIRGTEFVHEIGDLHSALIRDDITADQFPERTSEQFTAFESVESYESGELIYERRFDDIYTGKVYFEEPGQTAVAISRNTYDGRVPYVWLPVTWDAGEVEQVSETIVNELMDLILKFYDVDD